MIDASESVSEDAGEAGSPSDSDVPPEPAEYRPSSPARTGDDATHIIVERAAATPFARAAPVVWLRDRLREAVALVDRPVSRVAVAITDDSGIAALHERHMDEPGPTDVLTFQTEGPGGTVEADIAVNADEAARRAAELGHDPARELLLYALHGVLHCVGHDDHDAGAYAAMHREEDRILEAIGIGATFDLPVEDQAGGSR